MRTRIRQADEDALREAANLIRAGEVVAFPTETVYGLGANALDAVAVTRIFTAKGRPAHDPLIVHVSGPEQFAEVVGPLPSSAQPRIDALIAAFWPGPLTLLLPRSLHVPPSVTAGLFSVGVRMPAHPVALALIREAGVPIAAPSANLFGHTSPTTAQHVMDDLAGRIPFILDGGPTPLGVESTILDPVSDPPRLYRPGGVPLEALREVIGGGIEIVERRTGEPGNALPTPGLFVRHYAPHAEMHLFEGADKAVRHELMVRARALLADGRSVGLLIADEDRPALATLDVPCESLGSLADLDQIARNLFARLRALDAQRVQFILARQVPAEGIGLAVRDRLIRAAEGRVVTLPV